MDENEGSSMDHFSTLLRDHLNHFRAHEAIHEAAHQHERSFRPVQVAPGDDVVDVGSGAHAIPAHAIFIKRGHVMLHIKIKHENKHHL